MTYNPQWVDNNILDPTKFGNWILVEEYNVDDESSFSETISNVKGDTNDRWRVEINILNTDAADNAGIGIQFNGDTGSNYKQTYHYNADSAVAGVDPASRTEIFVGFTLNGDASTATAELFLKSGKVRSVIANDYRQTAATDDITVLNSVGWWTDTTTEVDSITLTTYSTSTGEITGTVRVYRWQEIVPVELHSLELVAEYNLSADGLNETITWDGEQDDYIRIEAAGDLDFCMLRLNGDGDANYEEGRLDHDGGTPDSGATSRNGFVFTASSGQDGFTVLEANLKNVGTYRLANVFTSRYIPANPDSNVTIRSTYWTNDSDDVTSITLIDNSSGAGSSTGNIKVYRRAKTSILSTAPDALHGLSQASVDTTSLVTVSPGSVELKGKNLHLQSPTTVDVYGNLRSGDSISGGEYVYLYAYDSNNSVGLEYSTSKPTKDRYGNTVTFEFSSTDFTQGLYHPSDPTRRYIGEVYIESDLSMRNFTQCKPGYCKGTWQPITSDANTLGSGNEIEQGSGTYERIGSRVLLYAEFGNISTAGQTGGNGFYILGNPLPPNNQHYSAPLAQKFNTAAVEVQSIIVQIRQDESINVRYLQDDNNSVQFTIADLTSGATDLTFNCVYTIDDSIPS